MSRTTHGHSPAKKRSKTYLAWRHILSRCLCTTDRQYPSYGGRGITVCMRWRKFENFLADMGPAPRGRSIDRRDNNKGYSKSNCRWATPTEQQQNTRRNRNLTFEGVTLCAAEWARRLGLTEAAIHSRLLYGWSVQRTLSTALMPRNECGAIHWITYDGETCSVAEWARRTGLKNTTIHKRMAKGWSAAQALTTPAIVGSNQQLRVSS